MGPQGGGHRGLSGGSEAGRGPRIRQGQSQNIVMMREINCDVYDFCVSFETIPNVLFDIPEHFALKGYRNTPKIVFCISGKLEQHEMILFWSISVACC